MKVCYTGGAVKDCGSYYSVATNAVELRIWFLTDDILRIRAGFDGDWDEASYSLTMTAWESRTDELMKDCRKRVQSAAAALTDGDRQAVIQGRVSRSSSRRHRSASWSMIRTQSAARRYSRPGLPRGQQPPPHPRQPDRGRRLLLRLRREIRRDQQGREIHEYGSRRHACYNAKETDSLYKHIPFYIRLNRGTKQAVGYFYHNTAECDFNMGREKRSYWHRYSSYRTDAGDIDLFLIAGPSIREIIERYTDLTGKSVMLPKAALATSAARCTTPSCPRTATMPCWTSSTRPARKASLPTASSCPAATAPLRPPRASSAAPSHGTTSASRTRQTGSPRWKSAALLSRPTSSPVCCSSIRC